VSEDRLLAGLDEAAPPQFLADDVQEGERQPQRKNVALRRAERLDLHEVRMRRKARTDGDVDELHCRHRGKRGEKSQSANAPIFGAYGAYPQGVEDCPP
jgi:hypothetical protein